MKRKYNQIESSVKAALSALADSGCCVVATSTVPVYLCSPGRGAGDIFIRICGHPFGQSLDEDFLYKNVSWIGAFYDREK